MKKNDVRIRNFDSKLVRCRYYFLLSKTRPNLNRHKRSEDLNITNSLIEHSR